jgi:hypothetical protein
MKAVRYRWTSGAWKPLPGFIEDCEGEFIEGEERWLEAQHDRSMRSHSHYFAALAEAWANLPEDYRIRFPHPHNLRKWCLIETDWCVEMEPFVLITAGAALRLAHELTKQYPDDRIYVDPADTRTVRWKQAMSQSVKAMGSKAFERSKDDVLNKAADLIGVSVDQLRENAGRAA